jgi:hypothetical protein
MSFIKHSTSNSEAQAMNSIRLDTPKSNCTEVRIAGKTLYVPSAEICGRTVVVTGNSLRMATVKDEELLEGPIISNPGAFVEEIRSSGLRADIFSFSQGLTDVTPRHRYHREWDNAAVLPITSYDDWLKAQVEYDVRKAVKKASRVGVIVTAVEFDDAFVRGVVEIYNETPIRQGRRFWHYQKDFEMIRHELSTYLERSEFIAAYYQDELIGFIKMVYVDRLAKTLHVISKIAHYDKKPTNALLAKAVEICERKGVTGLVYGNFVYDNAGSSLTEFKRRSGFEKLSFPRYYVPLTTKGKIALKLELQHGVKALLPQSAAKALRSIRSAVYRYLPKRSMQEKLTAPAD